MDKNFLNNTIVFWQNMISPHQAAYINALSETNQFYKIIYSVDQGLSIDRVEMGLEMPYLNPNIEVVYAANEEKISTLLSIEHSIHIFEGIKGYKTGWTIIQKALNLNCMVGVMSESIDLRGYRFILRHMASILIERRYIKKINFFLCISSRASRWYSFCGAPDHKLFQFTYVVEPKRNDVLCTSSIFRIIFVGSLIKRKGVDILLSALNMCKNHNWELFIVGNGPEEEFLMRLSLQFNIEKRIKFMKYLPNEQVVQTMQTADLLVLPSRYDGWGAVVNEALMVGTPVVCSTSCGASDLINNSSVGDVFKSGNHQDLSKILQTRIQRGKQSAEARAALRRWSCCIDGRSIALYLIEIIRSVSESTIRPIAPWKI
ncbi:glycosyltransferase [Fibrella aquatilis]|uniref:Glycosyltransferase family 4 protein n=1 Tax=Fibrella aquatilis TaxID=2817059 RepID=A0A939G9N6_9BACT|nr:glycosyltransferase [Fibrella aquatilis]MBO0933560.1 glycosyltransferase family 4 protein [Fibrella aquatilis]